MAEVLSIVSVIHGLHRVYEDCHEAADTLRRLANTGRSVNVFLRTIEGNIANNSAEYPPDFLTWFDEEKTIVENLANQIHSHVAHVQSLTETSRLHGGLAQAWSQSRISLIESMLAQQLTLLYHMVQISKE